MKAIDSQLQHPISEWQRTFDSIPSLITILDNNHHIIKANRAVWEALGCQLQDLLDQPCYRLFHGLDSPPDFCPHSQLMQNGLEHSGEIFEPLLNKWLEVTVTPQHDQDGNISGSIHVAHDITARKHTEEALQASEYFFKESQRAANIGSYRCNFDNDCWESSNVLDQIFGIDERYNKSIQGWLEIIHPDDRAMMDQYLKEEVISKQQQFNREYRIIRVSDGEPRWLLGLGDVGFDTNGNVISLIGTIQDVTAHKEADENIRLNEARLEGLLRISQYDDDSTMQEFLDYALAEALDLTSSQFGYIYYYDESSHKFTLNSWSDAVMEVCSITEKQTIYELDKTGIWGEAVRQKRPIILNDYQAVHPLKKGYPEGHAPLLRFLTIPVIIQNRIVAVIGIANKQSDYNDTDVRQLTLMMDTVWKTTDRKQAKEELNKKNIELEYFVYAVSHDLRSPLVTFKTFLGYLKEDLSAADSISSAKDMEFMQSAANRMEAMLNEFLDLSRIGRVGMPHEEVAFRELVSEAFEAEAGQMSSMEIYFWISDTDLILRGDRRRLLQIWQNLLNNALKYMGDQIDPRIEIGVDNQQDETIFSVCDNGIGIVPKYHDKVFGMFEQMDRKSSGIGMGLTMVKRIVELYGGRIWIESQNVGPGSCFRFTLPETLNYE